MEKTIEELVQEQTVLSTELNNVYRQLRIKYLEQLLEDFGVTPNDRVLRKGVEYQLCDWEEMLKFNDLGTPYVYLYGRKIKKDGTPSKKIEHIYVWNNRDLVKVL